MMLNKPSNYIEKIGRQTLYTIMLLSVLQLNTSFSDIRHSQDKLKDVVEVPLDLKEIYKANISKSVLEAKSFPIHFNYAHEKELKEGGFILRRLVTFDDKTQSFTLTDGEGKKKYFYFHVKVPFDYGKESITKLYIKSFGFNAEKNKFTMEGIYKWESESVLKETVGKILVGSVVQRELNLKKTVMLDVILPGMQGEKRYVVKINIDNPDGDIAEATIIEYIPKKEK